MTIPAALFSRLREAKHVVIFTGAGISAESGIPTFRDAMTGLWERFDAQQLATPEAFHANPSLVWGWYEWRRMCVMQANPNPAHQVIAALAKKVPRLTAITQNVDDLHERAGSTHVFHLHGSLFQPRCIDCDVPYLFIKEIPDEPEGGRHLDPPRCDDCGGLIRPGVVWFGEAMPKEPWDGTMNAIIRDGCDVFFSIGTSSLVYPAAELPFEAARRGATVVQINPTPTQLDSVATFNLTGAAGLVLPDLVQQAFGI